jgi:hypothetical protein
MTMDTGLLLMGLGVSLAGASVVFAVLAHRKAKWILERDGVESTFSNEVDFHAAMTPVEKNAYLAELCRLAASPETSWKDRHIMRRWGR